MHSKSKSDRAKLRSSKNTFYRWCACALFSSTVLCIAQTDAPPSLGIFEQQADVGTVSHPGSASFDAVANTYALTGAGENVWATADHFHFVWKKVTGDATLSADIALGAGPEEHRKALLMIRQSLDPSSPYADVAVHGSGLTSLQFRDEAGAPTHEIESRVSGPHRVRLARRGDRFYFWVAASGSSLQFAGGSIRVPMHGDVYVGIGVTAHNKDAVQQATFSNVDLQTGAGGGSEARYSTIQTIAVASTDSRAAYVSPDRLNTPSWSADGNTILFDHNGKVEQLEIATGAIAPAAAELPDSFGQEHSPDGKFLYMISNRSGSAQLWRSEPDGSGTLQITNLNVNCTTPHISPDGKQIVFLTYPAGNPIPPQQTDVTLRVITLADNSVKILTKIVGGGQTLGGQPWSPDGKQVTFVTYQQIAP